jgi:DNA-binding NarL/FixJ family response regulator
MLIRLVVADSHPLTRLGLSALVAAHADVEVVAEATDTAELRRCVTTHAPTVVVLDFGLAGGDALELARELRDRDANLGIVILAAHGEDDVLFRALDHGASAFVDKRAPPTELLCAIRHAAVAARSFTAANLGDALARRQRNEARFALSPRERQVLDLLRDSMSIPSVARTMFVSQSTAKTYVSRLYEKLGASNRAQALMIALRHGLITYDALSIAS